MELQSRVLKYEMIKWRELEVLQSDSLKEISSDDYNRLKNSILENKFIQPFFVWESDKIYCLDGKHNGSAIDFPVSRWRSNRPLRSNFFYL